MPVPARGARRLHHAGYRRCKQINTERVCGFLKSNPVLLTSSPNPPGRKAHSATVRRQTAQLLARAISLLMGYCYSACALLILLHNVTDSPDRRAKKNRFRRVNH